MGKKTTLCEKRTFLQIKKEYKTLARQFLSSEDEEFCKLKFERRGYFNSEAIPTFLTRS